MKSELNCLCCLEDTLRCLCFYSCRNDETTSIGIINSFVIKLRKHAYDLKGIKYIKKLYKTYNPRYDDYSIPKVKYNQLKR